MKNIVIVDDDAIVRNALKQILEAKQYHVIGTGENGIDAIALYQSHQPDIILLDIRMKKMTGLAASKEILRHDSHAKILFITTFQDDAYIDEALKLGCAGYILKENIAGIVPAVEAVLSGQMVFGPKVVDKLPSVNRENLYSTALTERENDILILIADGLNNSEIATKLYLSEGTVRNYISTMLDKLALRDRTQLAVYYYKNLHDRANK